MAHNYSILKARFRYAVLAILLIMLPACRVTDLTLWHPEQPALSEALGVERILGVTYAEGDKADGVRHRLDIYLPKGKKDFPVVVLVHGGAWIVGDNRCCGLYSSVGEFLASQGICAVLPNYRLSPSVKHPEHIKDVARAVAWTKAYIGEYGGRTDQLFLAGHSAGGHLVTLLTTDAKYLEAVGMKTADIKGCVAISGVYEIPPNRYDVRLGGVTGMSFHIDEMMPLRDGGPAWGEKLGLPGIPLSLNVFGAAFGDDPKTRADASPISHVRPGLPPILLLSAENDLPGLKEMAREFEKSLKREGNDVQLLTLKERNHNSIIFSATQSADPTAAAIVDFVARQSVAPALR